MRPMYSYFALFTRGLAIFVAGTTMGLLIAACAPTIPESTSVAENTSVPDFTVAPQEVIKTGNRAATYLLRLQGNGTISARESYQLETFVADVGGNRPESLRVQLSG